MSLFVIVFKLYKTELHILSKLEITVVISFSLHS